LFRPLSHRISPPSPKNNRWQKYPAKKFQLEGNPPNSKISTAAGNNCSYYIKAGKRE